MLTAAPERVNEVESPWRLRFAGAPHTLRPLSRGAMRRAAARIAWIPAALLAACGGSARVATPPRVTAVGPFYRAGSLVAIYFTLADDEGSPADVLLELKRGDGPFVALGGPGTGEAGPGGDGLRALIARRGGTLHRFLWRPPADLEPTEPVTVRLTPSEPAIPDPQPFPALWGQPVEGSPFTLQGLEDER